MNEPEGDGEVEEAAWVITHCNYLGTGAPHFARIKLV